MLRAGALFVAVTISFVIAVLISLLIVLAFHYKIQNRENLLQKKLERNVNSSIVWLMNNSAESSEASSLMDLYGEGNDSVQIRKSSWGVYEIAIVKAFSGKYNLTKSVEYGYRPDESFSPAVYMPDYNQALRLSGKTVLRGICYLPETRNGLEMDYASNSVFQGIKEVEIKRSKNNLPPMDEKMIKKISGAFSPGFFSSQGYQNVSLTGDSVVQSFLDSTLLVVGNGNMSLTGKFLSGNVVVFCDGVLTVDASCGLENILLFAQTIRFSSGFKGNVQAFAQDSIIIEENCLLRYPSVAGLFRKKEIITGRTPNIHIKKNSSLSGMIFTSQYLGTDLSQTLVIIDKESKVHGHIYCDGKTRISGSVEGMVWSKIFSSAKGDDNQLLDAVIDRTKLSVHYAGSSLVASGKKKKNIKWLE